jgi:ATP-binding cassette subfamily C protein
MPEDSYTAIQTRPPARPGKIPAGGYTWRWVLDRVLAHRRELVVANAVALVGVIAAVPIPLVMPLLVDQARWSGR